MRATEIILLVKVVLESEGVIVVRQARGAGEAGYGVKRSGDTFVLPGLELGDGTIERKEKQMELAK